MRFRALWLLQPCGSSSQSPPPAVRLEIVAEAARLEADMKDATQRFLDGFERSLSMQNSRIGLIASLMWLRPTNRSYRLTDVASASLSISCRAECARYSSIYHFRTPCCKRKRANTKKYKPNMSSLLSDISHRRHHCYQTSG